MSANESLLPIPSRTRKLWKTALLLAGSGLLGGVAFALWNRRELTEIQSRSSTPAGAESSAPDEEDIY